MEKVALRVQNRQYPGHETVNEDRVKVTINKCKKGKAQHLL